MAAGPNIESIADMHRRIGDFDAFVTIRGLLIL